MLEYVAGAIDYLLVFDTLQSFLANRAELLPLLVRHNGPVIVSYLNDFLLSGPSVCLCMSYFLSCAFV